MPKKRTFKLKWTNAATKNFQNPDKLTPMGQVGLRKEIEENLENWFGGRHQGYVYVYGSQRFNPTVTLRLESKIVDGNEERYLISVDDVN